MHWRRKLALVAAFGLGCGAAQPASRMVVDLEGPRTTVRVEALSTSAACVISGPGELENASNGAFSVYSTPTSDEALVTVARPSSVAMAWTELPNPEGGPARARVHTGNGATPLARIAGWASLEGRAFQLRREAEIVPAHVWLDGGISVEVRGFGSGRVIVARRSFIPQPLEFVAMAHCADVAYEPKQVEPEPPPLIPTQTFVAVGHALRLRGRPDGPIVYELGAEARLDVAVTGTKDAWRRVEGRLAHVRFDGWVPAADVAPATSLGYGRLGGSHQTRPPSVRRGRIMQVVRETPLLMGPDPASARAIGVLEVGAKLDVVANLGETVGVLFYPATLTPPDDMRFFTRPADLLIDDDL